MNDHIKSEISSYLASGLTESRNRQIEAHVAACEKCRSALNKARTKLARVKREALKRAAADPLPNLFLARQGKDVSSTPASHGSWIIAAGIIIIVAGMWGYRSKWAGKPHSASISETPMEEPDPIPSPAPTPAATAPQSSAPSPVKVPISGELQQQWSGTDSAIKEPKVSVARHSEAFKRLLNEAQIKEVPVVDFATKLVIGVFVGPRPPGTTITMSKIEELDDGIYAPYKVSAAPVLVNGTTDPSTVSYPYLLAVFPRVDQKIKVFAKE